MSIKNRLKPKSELRIVLESLKQYFVLAGIFSAAINLLYLVPIIYMLQVYDRVISSGSYATLSMLTLLLVVLLCAQAGFEWVRSMILIGASNKMEAAVRPRVSEATFKRSLLTAGVAADSQPLNDLQQLRQFLMGQGLFAFLDAPWCPIYIFVMFLFHPWFGVAAVFAIFVMIALAIANNRSTKETLQEANRKSAQTYSEISGTLQNAEVIQAMGMADNLRNRQNLSLDQVLQLQAQASKSGGVISSISKGFRLIMQSLLLGLGALLALRQDISPGMMIAGSLLLGRALAPIDLLVGSWRGFTIAQVQFDRLSELLAAIPEATEKMPLPSPKGKLSAERLIVVPPGSKQAVVNDVSLFAEPGQTLGIIGPSASGKSSLARALLGIWPAASGKVRLDGADISSWDRQHLGAHIGYLPQNIELFTGTISENIARFGTIEAEKIVEAANYAGIHEMILSLPDGYDTKIGGSKGVLSGGQRQRIGLARAIYDSPRLIVLDEPNSNLDDQGEKALINTISTMTEKGATMVLITHRTNLLMAVDKILVLKNGKVDRYGTRAEVITAMTGIQTASANA
jgi:ATP-binding cassette subfamily C protein EexD